MRCYKMTKKDMTRGLCWKYALACLLGISPKKIPNFVTNNNNNDDIGNTRKWLKKKFKKTLVYIPINQFMESSKKRENPCGGPDGYSIMIISSTDNDIEHAVIAKDGKFFFDSCDSDHNTFTHPTGFFVMYNCH